MNTRRNKDCCWKERTKREREREEEVGTKVRDDLGIEEGKWRHLSELDKDGLIKFYESANGRNWNREGGIECQIKNSRVAVLTLIDCNLTGNFENSTITTRLICCFVHSLNTTNS